MSRTTIVYLIHFQTAYKGARHYIGSTKDLTKRVEHHRAGTGAKLLKAINLAGIDWEVVRTWAGGRQEERALKNRKKASHFCPVCQELAMQRKGVSDAGSVH